MMIQLISTPYNRNRMQIVAFVLLLSIIFIQQCIFATILTSDDDDGVIGLEDVIGLEEIVEPISFQTTLQQTKHTTISTSFIIKHVVMFNLKNETSNDIIQAIQNGLLNLPKEILYIHDYELGIDLLLESGQTHPSGKNRLLCWSCTFLNADDYENYSNHPIHMELLNSLIKPNILPGSRAAIQYQIKK